MPNPILAVPNLTPTPLTVQQAQAKVTAVYKSVANQQFAQLLTVRLQLWNLIWNNPDSLTPQQAVAALGTNAGEVFRQSSLLTTFINGLIPGTVDDTPPMNVAINNDGTVTLTAK